MTLSRIVKIGAIHYGLFMLIPTGIAAMQIHPAATLIAAVPLMVWAGMFLSFIHKSRWAATIFWFGVTVLQWQVAAVIAACYMGFLVARWGIRELIRGASGSSSDDTSMSYQHRYLRIGQTSVGTGDQF